VGGASEEQLVDAKHTRLCTVTEVAKMKQVSRWTVRRLCEQRLLPSEQLQYGGQWRIHEGWEAAWDKLSVESREDRRRRRAEERRLARKADLEARRSAA
jgi:excisionase family DNA binding protein